MSYEIPGFTRSYEPNADLTNSWFKFVKLSGAVIAACAAVNDPVVGVLQNKPRPKDQGSVAITGNAAFAGTVMISGVSRVKTDGAAIAAGAPVYLTADGSVSATKATNAVCVGVAEEAVGAVSGALVSVLLKPLAAVA